MLAKATSMRQAARGCAPFGQHPPMRARLAVVRNNNPLAGNPQLAEAMKKVMGDPKMMEQMRAMQEAMKRPEVQQQMAEMQAAMQNQALQARMAELKNDPELADIFADIQKNGMQAVMKYYNDPKFLSKLGEKLGDVAPGPGAAPGQAPAAMPPGAMAPPQEIEINNLWDAAKYGDEEAVEDFIAIGKDVNEGDKEGRTPLHYAVAFDQPTIARMLIDEGVNLDSRDSKNNTPLHYAAGYGRTVLVNMLLAAGADKAAQNDTGKKAFELATLDPRNPVANDQELLAKLKA